jgi:putative transposase
MSQSFVQIYVHIVFHTKNNKQLIKPEIEIELYSYLGGILKNYKSNPIQIGGPSIFYVLYQRQWHLQIL